VSENPGDALKETEPTGVTEMYARVVTGAPRFSGWRDTNDGIGTPFGVLDCKVSVAFAEPAEVAGKLIEPAAPEAI